MRLIGIALMLTVIFKCVMTVLLRVTPDPTLLGVHIFVFFVGFALAWYAGPNHK